MSEMGTAKGNAIPRKAIAPKIQNDTQPLPTSEGQQNPPTPLSVVDEKNNKADNTMTNKSPVTAAERDPTPKTAPTPSASNPAHSSGVSSSSEGATATATAAALGESIPTSLSGKEKPSIGSLSTAAANNNDSCGLPPPDFQGEVETNNELPSPETLRKIESYTVLDADGKSHTFKSLYAGHNVARRVMIIFVRHFFCGNCQEYLRTLSAAITPDALLQLPVSTFIAVVGCGGPELIGHYVKETNCPFPVYTDPTRKLYAELGMLSTLKMGQKPAYLRDVSFAKLVASSVFQGLKQVKSGLVTKMGDQRQVGGEFLFEPATLSLEPPIATPVVAGVVAGEEEKVLLGESVNGSTGDHHHHHQHRDDAPIRKGEDEDEDRVEPKRVTWCHRMKTTRDHAEIPELMEVLGLESTEDGTGTIPILLVGDDKKKQQRWSKALQTRKGTGLSMATQMSRMSLEASAAASSAADSGTLNSGRSSTAGRSREEIAKVRSVSPSLNVVPVPAMIPVANGGSSAAAAAAAGGVNGKCAV